MKRIYFTLLLFSLSFLSLSAQLPVLKARQLTYLKTKADFEDDGFFENICPSTVWVTASSWLSSGKNGSIYHPGCLVDGGYDEPGLETAWVENAEGDGIGEWFEFHFNSMKADFEPWTYGGFKVFNGYCKSEAIWQANNRVKKLKGYLDGVAVSYVLLEDVRSAQILSVAGSGFYEKMEKGSVLRFEIVEVYEGTKYEDTAISMFLPTCSP